jgi:flagellar biosynthesis/type III secretory pathway protein FliH
MRPAAIGSRAELRVACLRRIVAAQHLDEERRFLLFNFVATYIESDQRISDEYDELFHRHDNREVLQEMMTWAEKIEARGYSLGRQEGCQEGRQEGRQESRQLLLRQLMRKFGSLNPGVQQKIESAGSDQILEWGERLVTAQSLEETFAEGEPVRSRATR